MFQIEEARRCTECGSVRLDMDYYRGEVVCLECGFILADLTLYQDNSFAEISSGGMHTEVSARDRDHYGKPLTAENRAQANRLRKWQNRMHSYRSQHRNAYLAYQEIDRICQVMDLPPGIRDLSRSIYSKAVEKGYTLGRPMEPLVASTVYSACRLLHVPRTLNEFSGSTGIDRRIIGRSQMRLARDLSLQLPPPRPSDFLDRFCYRLQLSDATKGKAREILEDERNQELISGKDPSGLAAAAIYLATILTGQIRTQGEVETFTGITQVTIRKRCKDLQISDGS